MKITGGSTEVMFASMQILAEVASRELERLASRATFFPIVLPMAMSV